MSDDTAKTRLESDSMGNMEVPADAYYGAQTQRAVLNFPISGRRFPRRFVRALGMIKMAAAEVNHELGGLSDDITEAIRSAAREVIEGELDDHFVLDIYQTGSGTSTNMNANEVIANRATELMGGEVGSKLVHPNDHVNQGQSSNDVIPTAIHVAAAEALVEDLLPALARLYGSLDEKANSFDKHVKIGRTHLQDATPVRLGQEFSGYARQIELGAERIESCLGRLGELAQGGTAVGTGINTHAEFGARVASRLSDASPAEFTEAQNHFEAQGAQDAAVEVSGALKTIAVSLIKIANDIRLLGSGPRCGLGEIILPPVAPGSSIMPGKVNPVIAESVIQVGTQVIGNDATITAAGQWGFFELNTMLPVIASNLLESIALLATSADNFATRCIEGIEVDAERAKGLVEGSLAMVTSLAPVIGYDRAADIAKEAFKTGKTVREVCEEQSVLPADELAAVLDPWSMTEPDSA
ncbi:MAG: aspartate ammonia-lyase [Acidobacteria bacterium]|nr:aspartate ammonia-lyase [Acidobacteriota bacterium]